MALNAGSVVAEATLDISKYKAAAAEMGADGEKIVNAMEKAAAALQKAQGNLDVYALSLEAAEAKMSAAQATMDQSVASLQDIQAQLDAARGKVEEFTAANERAAASGDQLAQSFALGQLDAAQDEIEELEQELAKQQIVVDKNSAAWAKAAASVESYKNKLSSTQGEVNGLTEKMESLGDALLEGSVDELPEILGDVAGSAKDANRQMKQGAASAKKYGKKADDLNSVLGDLAGRTVNGAAEKLSSLSVQAMGLSTNTAAGTLATKGLSVGIKQLSGLLGPAGIALTAAGSAAAYAGKKMYDAYQEAHDGTRLWTSAIEDLPKERVQDLVTKLNAKLELENLGELPGQVQSVYKQIGDALTDGKPDTAAVIAELTESTTGMFAEVRGQIQSWYDEEMSKLDFTAPEGVAKAAELTEEYNELIAKVNELDANTAGWIASYAGKSTAECEAALTTLESYEDELERLAARAEELTALMQSSQEAAYQTVKLGITDNEEVATDALIYVNYRVEMEERNAEEDYRAQLAEIEQQIDREIQANPGREHEIREKYRPQLEAAEGSYKAEKLRIQSEHQAMLGEVFQGLVEAIGQDHPEIAEALHNAITQGVDALDDVNLSGTPLPAIMKAAVESGMLEGVTNVDLSTTEGQIAAMMQLLGQGTAEAAEEAFRNLYAKEVGGNTWGELIAGHIGLLGNGIEALEGTAEQIHSIAGKVKSAMQELEEAGEGTDLEDLSFRLYQFRESFNYNDAGVTGIERIAGAFSSISSAFSQGNLTTEQLAEYGAELQDILSVLDVMDSTGGAENVAFLSDLAAALNALGYDTDAGNVVDTLHNLADAYLELGEASESVELPEMPIAVDVPLEAVPEVQTVEPIEPSGLNAALQAAGNMPIDYQQPVNMQPVPQAFTPMSAADAAGAFSTLSASPADMNIPVNMTPVPAAVAPIPPWAFAGAFPAPVPITVPVAVTLMPETVTLGDMTGLEDILTAAGTQAATNYAAAISNGSAEAAAAGRTIAASALDAARANLSGASSIGRSFSAGLAAGISAGRSGVIAAAAAVASAAAAAARSKLAIHSPSRVTRELGEFFDLGFIRGVEDMTPDIRDAVRSAVYVEPPAGAAYGAGRERVADVRVTGPAMDYEALADAMRQMQLVFTMHDRRMAEALSNETARAQNLRSRSIALGYGRR